MAEQKSKTKKTSAPAKVATTNTLSQKHTTGKQHRRVMTGTVVSDKMMKTRVVMVVRKVREGLYGKYITKRNKFKMHDENNQSKVGDLVDIIESRPLSKDKRWALQKIVRSAAGDVLKKS